MLHGFNIMLWLAAISLRDLQAAALSPINAPNADSTNIAMDVHRTKLMRQNLDITHISNCTRIYYLTVPMNDSQADKWANCSHLDISSLNEILQNQHLEVSVNQDCIFNKSSMSTSNFITILLSIGDVNSSDIALTHLHKHVEQMQDVNHLHSRENSATSDISSDNQNGKKSSLSDLKEVTALLQSFRSIQNIILNSMDLESFGSNVHNVSEDFLKNHSFEEDITAVQEIEEYLIELDIEVESIKNLNKLLQDQNFTVLLEIPWVRCLLTTERWETELNIERKRQQQVLDTFKEVQVLTIFRTYVDPVVYSIILTVGLLWNGVLLLMFARQKQLWTTPNIMIFNLAVADILSLILNLLLFYFAHYYVPNFQMNGTMCKFYITVRPLTVAVSALSVVVLSILRYVATGQPFKIHTKQILCSLSTRARVLFYIIIVWILSLCLAIPYSFVIMFSRGMCFRYGDGHVAKMVTLFEFLFYCVLLPSIVVIFNCLTAKKLRQSTRDLSHSLKQNGQDLVRNRSAKVLMALVIVFLISYVPHYLWRVLHRWLLLDIWEVRYRCIDKITYYFLFANCCFNPISLYIVSGTFRKLFNYYFCYTFYKQDTSSLNLERLQSSSATNINHRTAP